MRVFFIDNFDSFTYNLVDEFEKRNCEVLVYGNNADIKMIDSAIKKFKPNLIVICSGTGAPKDAGNSMGVIRNHYEKIPVFGVGLGHLCIIEVFGGNVDKSIEIVSGKPSKISHDGKTIFKKLESPFKAGRYYTLAGVEIPYCLEVSARSESDVVMGVRHKEHFVEGIQFDPSSILTPLGYLIIENLIKEINKK